VPPGTADAHRALGDLPGRRRMALLPNTARFYLTGAGKPLLYKWGMRAPFLIWGWGTGVYLSA